MDTIDYDALLAEDQRVTPPAPDSPSTVSRTSNGMLDFDRAKQYLAKVPGSPEGERNAALNYLAYHLLELFPRLSGDEHTQLCLEFNGKCSPSLPQREAEATIRSAWEGCHKKGQIGAKSTLPRKTTTTLDGEKRENPPEAWEPPVPLDEHNLPSFPIECLPPWLRLFVGALAEATQTPVDLAGMLALGVVATAVAKKVVVQVKPDWTEALNIYIVVVLPPGSRKSVVFRIAIAPLEVFEREQARWLRPEITEARERADILRKTLEETKRKASRAAQKEQDELTEKAVELAKQLEDTEIPLVPRLIADDCTPERLATLLSQNGGRIAILSAEGTILEILAGRYSSTGAPNLEVLLKGHAGDMIRVDRVNRPPEYIQDPAITLVLCVQPDVIRSLSVKPGFRGRGLLGRIEYALPMSNLGYRKINPPDIPDTIQNSYHDYILTLAKIPSDINEKGESMSCVLDLLPDARRLILDFMGWLEPLLAKGAKFGHMTDWAGKLTGAVVRIAGLLHLATQVGDDRLLTHPIESQTVDAAIKIGKYLIPHAQAAYAEMDADPATENARRILEWIKRTAVRSFTKRDLQRGIRSLKAKDLDGPLTLLEDHGFIRGKDSNKPYTGRPRSQTFEVNHLWNPESENR